MQRAIITQAGTPHAKKSRGRTESDSSVAVPNEKKKRQINRSKHGSSQLDTNHHVRSHDSQKDEVTACNKTFSLRLLFSGHSANKNNPKDAWESPINFHRTATEQKKAPKTTIASTNSPSKHNAKHSNRIDANVTPRKPGQSTRQQGKTERKNVFRCQSRGRRRLRRPCASRRSCDAR